MPNELGTRRYGAVPYGEGEGAIAGVSLGTIVVPASALELVSAPGSGNYYIGPPISPPRPIGYDPTLPPLPAPPPPPLPPVPPVDIGSWQGVISGPNYYLPNPGDVNANTDALMAFAYTTGLFGTLLFHGGLGPLLNRPTLKCSINSGYHPITLELPSAVAQAGLVEGMVVKLTQRGNGSRVVYSGVIDDLPDYLDAAASYTVELVPLVTELSDANFDADYVAPGIEIADMVRSAVAATRHLYCDAVSCPNTGKLGVYTFQPGGTALDVLNEALLMAGPDFWWFVDEVGRVWFQRVNYSKPVTYLLKQGVDYSVRTKKGSISGIRNVVTAQGGIPKGGTEAVRGFSDKSANSPYGRRALTVYYSNLADVPTLNSIANSIATQLAVRKRQIEMTLPFLHDGGGGRRVDMAQVGAATVSYYEPSQIPYVESFQGKGGVNMGQGIDGGVWPFVVHDVEIDGPTQKIIVGDMPVTADDFQYLANAAAAKLLQQQQANPPGDPGTMGVNVPAEGGGIGLIARGTSAFSVTLGGTVVLGQVPFVIDSTKGCDMLIMATATMSGGGGGFTTTYAAAGPDTSTPQLLSGRQEITLDGTIRNGMYVAPSVGPLPSGNLVAYIFAEGGSGSASGFWDIQVYTMATGGSAGTTGQGTPGTTGLANGTTLGSVGFDMTAVFATWTAPYSLNPWLDRSVAWTRFALSNPTPVSVSVTLSKVQAVKSPNEQGGPDAQTVTFYCVLYAEPISKSTDLHGNLDINPEGAEQMVPHWYSLTSPAPPGGWGVGGNPPAPPCTLAIDLDASGDPVSGGFAGTIPIVGPIPANYQFYLGLRVKTNRNPPWQVQPGTPGTDATGVTIPSGSYPSESDVAISGRLDVILGV